MALPAALQALSGSRATRVALIAAVTLSVLLNLVFLSLYLHGSTHSAEWHHASRAEATPNATAEEKPPAYLMVLQLVGPVVLGPPAQGRREGWRGWRCRAQFSARAFHGQASAAHWASGVHCIWL